MVTELGGLPLWAVHISDGLLTDLWWMGGFVVAGILAAFGARGIREEEIPRVALLTAAFFITSLIHVPVPGGPKTHLLLNGLLGVVLGPRAALAIPIGLFLQAVLFGHGGFTTLGVNSCVMTLPALLAWLLFQALRRLPWVRRPWFRAGLVAFSTMVFTLSLVYGVFLLINHVRAGPLNLERANAWLLQPIVLIPVVILSLLLAWFERGLEQAPEFPLGLLIGETTVLATILLNGLALLYGGQADWHSLVLLTFVIHLPLAVCEGIILGFTVGFLVRVKPELLGWSPGEKPECMPNSIS